VGSVIAEVGKTVCGVDELRVSIVCVEDLLSTGGECADKGASWVNREAGVVDACAGACEEM
jgi:hypothetical protein